MRNSQPQVPGQGELFEVPAGTGTPAKWVPPAQRESQRQPPPRWAAYKGPHRPCDVGRGLKHEGRPGAHLDGARYSRLFRGEKGFYCTRCAEQQRAADGLSGTLPARVMGKR